MQEIDRHLRNRRGSSPPFQEIEKWADDGADGAHWIKMVAAAFQKEEPGLMISLAQEEAVVAGWEDKSRWEDDGGMITSATRI
jgi:hypothetical protein